MFVAPPSKGGGVGIGTGQLDPAAKLEVAGGLKIGKDETFTSAGAACTKEGTLSLGTEADTALYLCSKTGGTTTWKALGKNGSVYGLQSKTMVAYGSWVESNTLQYNAEGSSTVSVTAPGFLRINGGAWVQSATISKGQTVQLGMYAPNANYATRSVVLTTGSEQDTWTIRTASATYVSMTYQNTITCYIGTACNQYMHTENPTENNCNSYYDWYITTYAGSASYSCSMYPRCNPGGARACGPYVVGP